MNEPGSARPHHFDSPEQCLRTIRDLVQQAGSATGPTQAALKAEAAALADAWADADGTTCPTDTTRATATDLARKLVRDHRPKRILHVGWVGSAVSVALAEEGAQVLSLFSHRGRAVAGAIRDARPNIEYRFIHEKVADHWFRACDLVVLEACGGHLLVPAPKLAPVATEDATWVVFGRQESPPRGLAPKEGVPPTGRWPVALYRRDPTSDENPAAAAPARSRQELLAEARDGAAGVCDEFADDFAEAYVVAAGIPGWLAPGEAAQLYRVGRTAERDVVEVGTYFGKSTFLLGLGMKQAGRDVSLITIDVHWRGLDPKTNAPLVLATDSQLAVGSMIKAHDLSRTIIQMIGWSQACLERIDFSRVGAVFIDGGHDYVSCRDDFLSVQRRLPQGHVIDLLFHDYTPSFPGVQRAIQEFCEPDPRFHRVGLISSLLVSRFGE